jgi:transcriptional regulator with XRE-family HTH domain
VKSNYDVVLERFSEELRSRLRLIFGKAITGESLAREFNLRAFGCPQITRETARRWLIGTALPEYGRLVVFKQWLDLDMDYIFDPNKGINDRKHTDDAHLNVDVLNTLDRISAEARALKESLVEKACVVYTGDAVSAELMSNPSEKTSKKL